MVREITISRDVSKRFGELVKDPTKFHYDPELARKLGLEGAPVMGVHLAALAAAQEEWTPRQSANFRSPLYLDRQGTINQGTIVSGSDKICTLEYGEGNRIQESSWLYVWQGSIDEGDISEFGKLIGARNQVGRLYARAITPSALVSFLTALNENSGSSYIGTNLETDVTVFETPEPGKIFGRVFQLRAPKTMKGKTFYDLGVTLIQEHREIAQGKVRTCTDGSLDLTSLRKPSVLQYQHDTDTFLCRYPLP